jgi:hypothetical protein
MDLDTTGKWERRRFLSHIPQRRSTSRTKSKRILPRGKACEDHKATLVMIVAIASRVQPRKLVRCVKITNLSQRQLVGELPGVLQLFMYKQALQTRLKFAATN